MTLNQQMGGAPIIISRCFWSEPHRERRIRLGFICALGSERSGSLKAAFLFRVLRKFVKDLPFFMINTKKAEPTNSSGAQRGKTGGDGVKPVNAPPRSPPVKPAHEVPHKPGPSVDIGPGPAGSDVVATPPKRF